MTTDPLLIPGLDPEPTEEEYDAANALCSPSETFVVMQADTLAERDAVLRVRERRAGIEWCIIRLQQQERCMALPLVWALLAHDAAVAEKDGADG